MIPILQAWLKDSVGVFVELDGFKNAVKDGMLFIRILRFYDAINICAIKNVFPSEDKSVCKRNLMQLKMWFELLSINLTDDIINEIVEGNLSASIDVLYQLYLVFVRGVLQLPTKQTERCIKSQYKNRYKISKSCHQDAKGHDSAVFKYSDNILKNKNKIEWSEKKYKSTKVKRSSFIAETAKFSDEENKAKVITNIAKSKCSPKLSELSKRREDDIYYVRHKLEKINTSLILGSSHKHVEYNEVNSGNRIPENRRHDLINKLLSPNKIQRNTLPLISCKPICEHELPLDVERYLQELKANTGFLCEGHRKRVKVRLHSSSLLDTAWTNFVDYEKNDLKEIISAKLAKPSMYEKDLAEKLSALKALNDVQKRCFTDLENNITRSRKSFVCVNISDSNEACLAHDKLIKEKNNATDDYDDDYDSDSCSYFDSSKHRYKYDNNNMYWLNEKKRTVELHRKLYAEKLKLQFERHYAICSQTLKDITDLAIKRAEFKREYGLEVPYYIWDDWKCLFKHEQHIFDIVNNFGELLFPVDPSELDTVKERHRQDILNESYFDAYFNATGHWMYLNDSVSFENQVRMVNHDNQIVLGYIVHKALETKYPLQPHPKPADIPNYLITAVVNGIDDVDALNDFKLILAKAEILVVDVHTAVNFCLRCYKEQNENNEYELRNEIETDIHSYNTEGGMEWEDENANHKCGTGFTQTTSSLFDLNETGKFEEAARLGQELFRMMLFGNEISFSILVDIIIQYIKHHGTKIKGWVLVNFPSTLYQASVLEYALSGKKFPFRLEDDTVSSTGSECKGSVLGNLYTESSIYDVESEVKNSRIVPNPRKYEGDDTFKSYFKMYITAIKGAYRHSGQVIEDTESLNDESKSTQLLEQPEKEGIPTLRQFYEEQGISFNVMYETFGLNLIKQLAHIVLLYFSVDSKLPRFPGDTDSEELVSDFDGNVSLQWTVPTLSVDEISLMKYGYDQRVSVVHIDEQDLLSIINMDNSSSLNRTEEVSRNFVDFPVQDTAMIALATFWETLETVYIKGFKEVFFLKRNSSYCVIPYIVFITKAMNLFSNREDNRQALLSEFLQNFNNIHNILRSDFEMKNELHLRVIELKEELIKLCEIKRDENKEMCKTIINQNWTYHDMGFYTNAFLRMSELEINRCLSTLEFLQDYYLAMLGNYISQPLPRLVVSKINIYHNEDVDITVENSSKANIVMATELEMEEEPEIESVESNDLYLSVINRFLNYDELKDTICPFYDLVKTKIDESFQKVLKVSSQVEKLISSEEAAALKKHADYISSKHPKRGAEKSKKLNKKKDKTAASSAEISTQNEQDSAASSIKEDQEKKDDEAKELLLKNLFEEWKEAVKNEIERLAFTLEIITHKVKSEFMEIENLMGGKFTEFDLQLNKRFIEEMSCIEDLCYLFQTAIEEKTPINARLFFSNDKFYAVRNPVEREVSDIKFPPALEEKLSEESFTIRQLEDLKEQLMCIAPSGIVTMEAFSQLIQDVIFYHFSHDKKKLVPNIWRKLKPHELRTLFLNIFGSYSTFEWKEFLVYCLDIPYPVMEDIIDARLQFLRYDRDRTESVSYEDYMKTTLWFQRELPENPLQALHNNLTKEFIFSLFSVDGNDGVNYTALLLSFCKDVDPKIGFGKALGLLLGRCVIIYEEDLYLEQILIDHIDTRYKVVKEILNEILDDIAANTIPADQDDSLLLNEIMDIQDDSISVDIFSSNTNSMLMKSMYHEFFRRHLICQWTSKVPSTVVISLLCLTISVVYPLDRVFLIMDGFGGIYQLFRKSNEDYIYIPEFVNSSWMEYFFKHIHKFSALSINSLIKDILIERKE